jgi:ribosomal protein S18 acetylase RimI-like enzyme
MSSLFAEARSDEWLGRMLGRDAYSLVFDAAANLPAPESDDEQELRRLLNLSPVFIFTKVPPKETGLIRFLEARGFHLIDTNLLFHKPVVFSQGTQAAATVRFATPADEAETVRIARSNFTYSRFHLDNQIPGETADKIKAEWVRNYFRGQRGDRLVVAEEEGHVVGFLLILCDEARKLITIDLIATEMKYRCRGIAGNMVRFAEGAIKGYEGITVGTQLANTPSIQLYERLGFALQSASHVFHYHN